MAKTRSNSSLRGILQKNIMPDLTLRFLVCFRIKSRCFILSYVFHYLVFGYGRRLRKRKFFATLDETEIPQYCFTTHISCYRLEEYAQTNYLHEAKRPETREKLYFGTNHQLYNLGGGNIGHLHQIREFNDRIRKRVGHIIRTQCIYRPEDPNSISDQSKRHHWSSLGRGMVR